MARSTRSTKHLRDYLVRSETIAMHTKSPNKKLVENSKGLKPIILLDRLSKSYIRKMTMPTANKFIHTSESKQLTNDCTRDNRERTRSHENDSQGKMTSNAVNGDTSKCNPNTESNKKVVRSKVKISNKKASDGKTRTDQITVSTKRKADIEVGMMTRSKKAKMGTDYELPHTVQIFSMEKPKPTHSKTKKIPNANKKTEQAKTSNAVAIVEFLPGEVVWAKIRGWSHWPAMINNIEGNRYEVYWFNDYRKTKIFRNQLFKFEKNFPEFSKKFPNIIGLETAAKEAMIYLMSKKLK